jgi:hypothetical protein
VALKPFENFEMSDAEQSVLLQHFLGLGRLSARELSTSTTYYEKAATRPAQELCECLASALTASLGLNHGFIDG